MECEGTDRQPAGARSRASGSETRPGPERGPRHLGRMNEQLWAFIEDLFASSELNRLPMAYGGGRIFAQPLVGISLGDDDIFQTYKQVVGPEHLTPAEMWGRSGFLKDEGLATRLRVVSIVFPYTDQIRDAGEASGDRELPPEIYSVLGKTHTLTSAGTVFG